MLSVHNYHLHFAPIQPGHATPTRRHKQPIVERGRSRIVSQAAIARRKSEERRKRAAIASQLVQQACSFSSRPACPPATFSRPSPTSNPTPALLGDPGPVASSSSCRLPTPAPSPRSPVRASESALETSDSCRRACVIDGANSSSVYEASSFFGEDEESPDSTDSLSLQEQMQQAYAACQTTCLPTPGEKHCRCRNMHRARVLYLKTQGIDVTSDDDPRIDQVRDEDFEFVPGGVVELDEESLAAIKEERERREREAQLKRCRAREHLQDLGSGQAVTSKAFTQRNEEESRSISQTFPALEFRTRRGRLLRSNTAILSDRCDELIQSSVPLSSSLDSTFGPTNQRDMSDLKPRSVSLREVVESLRGPLFPDSESQRSRSSSQDRILNSLLEPLHLQDEERLSAESRGKMGTGSRAWAFSRFSEAETSCIACAVSSESTISRTNSWASTTSGATTSTCITSPSSSPKSGALHLPSLVDEMLSWKRIAHSCRRYRRSSLVVVELSETPLRTECCKPEQDPTEASFRPARQGKDENVASVLVTRVRQSVHGLMDFANRMQQSYLRTIQFAMTMQPDLLPSPNPSSSHMRGSLQPLKPSGYRASPSDVQHFAPYPVYGPTRDLNLPSDLNMPLLPTLPNSDTPAPPRVFAPLAFVPPSPLRPREAPITPEWRLRPVANPCLLRLKAHAKCLYEKGIPWEGRAHSGSLGCGRERLTGVAFEGLGGSRLAFEAK